MRQDKWYVNLYGSNDGRVYVGPLGATCGVAEVHTTAGREQALRDAEMIVDAVNSVDALREQNRVLTEAFAKTTKGKVTINRYEHGGGRMFVDDGKNRDLIADTYNEGDREFIALCYEVFSKQAALTATSQPGGEG